MEQTLRLVFWELTARCNLKCSHCRAEAQEESVEGELTTQEILRIARDIRDAADPIIVLTGGEPLVRPDLFEIARACAGMFSQVALATNGTLVDDDMAREIADSGIRRVSISIDGATAQTHDEFRGVPGSFEQALSGLEALKKVGLSLQINTTVTRHNAEELESILTLALEQGMDAFHVFMLVPVGCGAEIDDSSRLSAERTEEILEWLFEKSLELRGRLFVKATCAPQYARIMREVSQKKGVQLSVETHGMNAASRGCLAGTGVCFVSRVGDVQPCGYLPVRVGNVLERRFGDIWHDSEVFDALRDPGQLKGKCGVCGYRVVCSGCRARAYALTGDFLSEEPDCPQESTGGKH